MAGTITTYLIWAVTGLFLILSFLPQTGSHRWWIRAMDFPRVHYVIVLAPLIVGCLVVAFPGRWAVVAALAVCALYQIVRIVPYTPFYPTEIKFARPEDGEVVHVMSLNVLMENENHDAVIAAINENDPDILFLMEIDDIWAKALEPVLERYTTVLCHPKDNHYGLIAATRLEVRDLRVEYLTTDPTPTAFGEFVTRSGQAFRFVGLHPQPPVPGVDTTERDDQLIYSARFARDLDLPVVVIGDFNAVAWSDITRSFKSTGQYLDPRIGRGILPSFDANHPVMRFPIDQLYVTPEIAMVSYSRGPNVGSDHFPMMTKLIFDADLAARLNRQVNPIADHHVERHRTACDRHRQRLSSIGRDEL